MQDLIRLFIEERFSAEKQEVLNKGLDILDKFENLQAYPILNDVVMADQTTHAEELNTRFEEAIFSALKDVAFFHGITIAPETRLSHLNKLCETLSIIQNLEDNTPVAILLEGNLNDVQVLVKLLTQYSSLSDIESLDLIEEIDPAFRQVLAKYSAEQAELEEPVQEVLFDMAKVLSFKKKYDDTWLGMMFLKLGTAPGLLFDVYYNLSDEFLLDILDHKELAMHLYSLFLISSDASVNPVMFYRGIAGTLSTDQSVIQEVESHLLGIIGEHENYHRAHEGKQ